MFNSLHDLGYNTFLSFPATDWETFTELQNLGVSDIYIDGPLGFQTKLLKGIKGDTRVRATPTVSPNRMIGDTRPAANFFFIRPEDLYLYDGAIDVVFFPIANLDQEETLFKVYMRKSFLYGLERLVPQINQTIPNAFIKPDFAQQRLNCGQKCKVPGYTCHICDTEFHLTNTVTDYFR